MRAVLFDTPGDESVLRWAETEAPTCAPHQVLVEVRATAVNRADLLQRAGHYPPPRGASEILGLEAAGVIAEVGAQVSGWAVGDKVMALVPGGGYAERLAVDARHILPVPARVGLPAAGAVPEVFLTAALNLFTLGGLERGQRVLVHGGSGGVGTAAIQLAALAGAEVWTTAGGPERCAACVALGAHQAIDHRAESFAARLGDAGGADLILDIMGAKYLDANLKSLRADGTLVVIGLQGGVKGELNLGLALSKRLRVVGSTLRALPDPRKAALVAAFRERWLERFETGELRPIVDRTLPITEVAEAHRAMAAGSQFGKILLTMPGEPGPEA